MNSKCVCNHKGLKIRLLDRTVGICTSSYGHCAKYYISLQIVTRVCVVKINCTNGCPNSRILGLCVFLNFIRMALRKCAGMLIGLCSVEA